MSEVDKDCESLELDYGNDIKPSQNDNNIPLKSSILMNRHQDDCNQSNGIDMSKGEGLPYIEVEYDLIDAIDDEFYSLQGFK